MAEKHVFDPVDVDASPTFGRADLEFYGINHFRPSFTVLIFFNDPKVTARNADRERPSYAGSFSIFGHDRCVGDEGHCEVHEHVRRFDDRPSHPLTRAFKRVIVTEALRRCLDANGTGTVTVTTVAGATESDMKFAGSLLDIQGMQLTTFE